MFCANCGSQIDDLAAFCPECGKPVKMTAAVNDSTKVNEKREQAEQNYLSQATERKTAPTNLQKPKSFPIVPAILYGVIQLITMLIMITPTTMFKLDSGMFGEYNASMKDIKEAAELAKSLGDGDLATLVGVTNVLLIGLAVLGLCLVALNIATKKKSVFILLHSIVCLLVYPLSMIFLDGMAYEEIIGFGSELFDYGIGAIVVSVAGIAGLIIAIVVAISNRKYRKANR